MKSGEKESEGWWLVARDGGKDRIRLFGERGEE